MLKSSNTVSRLKIFIAISVLLLGAGCARGPRITPGPAPAGPGDLSLLCQRQNVAWQADYIYQTIVLKRNNLKATLLVDSPVVLLGENKVVLSAPVRRSANTIIVPEDFKRKVLDYLAREVSHAISKFRKIVVDAGHGGKDPGAQGSGGTQEKTVVLDIARRLKENLEKRGIQVVMTRSRDEFLTLQERTEVAARSKADLFVSVHANASSSKSARGMEIYYLRDLTWTEKNSDPLDANRKFVLKNLSLDKGSRDAEKIVSDLLHNYKQEKSQDLAEYVNDRAAPMIHAQGRGSKPAGFYVLKNTLIPAILVEVGFLTNYQEEKLLMTGRYRQEIADALARTILDYAQK